ncbi:MAG TPA: hypothetical protein PLE95_09635 [Bacteroidales bacterium]|nr:hypothetical protein [Bacteroidales bacterium]
MRKSVSRILFFASILSVGFLGCQSDPGILRRGLVDTVGFAHLDWQMDFQRMQAISQKLAKALFSIMMQKNLRWGEDIALLITSDTVHYGDEDWGGKNYAPYGTDSTGNKQAVSHEQEIIRTCFEAELNGDKVASFYAYTVNPDNYREYKWTWCGRYSIPVGLLTSFYLQSLQGSSPLTGIPVAYTTSISQPHLKVEDLRMGHTAIATPRHWVGYPAIGFR